MTHWIEFESKSHLWKGVRCSTNIVGFPSLCLKQKRGELSALKGDHLIARAYENGELQMGARLLKPVRTNQKLWFLRKLVGLQCDDFSLRFEPRDPDSPEVPGIQVFSEQRPREPFTVLNTSATSVVRTKTRVRIESRTAPPDLDLMIACLTYFWNYFETDRTYD